MARSPDLFIIGGGIIGLTAAYRLARSGVAVSLIDRRGFGEEASWAGAGIIPPGVFANTQQPIDRLRAWGSEHFPEFTSELTERTGIDTGYWRSGGLEYAEENTLESQPLWGSEGIEYEQRSALLGPAFYFPGMAQVRNPWLLKSLVRACQLEQVDLRTDTLAAGWQLENGRVTGVRLLDDSVVSAKYYLVAAGAWGAPWLVKLGVTCSLFPVRGQIRLYHPKGEPLLNMIVQHGKRYLVPRADGRILVGSTEEPEAGFVNQTTAEAQQQLHEFATSLVPGLRNERAEHVWSGLRPATEDGLPYLGALPGHENVFAAMGHFRAGVQLSIGTAQTLTDWIHGRESIIPRDAFAPGRPPNRHSRSAFRS